HLGRLAERAEHDRDPAVLPQVRDGLRAAPGQVQVGHGAGPEYRERVTVSLRREVDVTVLPRRGRSYEEHVLSRDKLPEPIIQSGVDLAHGTSETDSPRRVRAAERRARPGPPEGSCRQREDPRDRGN